MASSRENDAQRKVLILYVRHQPTPTTFPTNKNGCVWSFPLFLFLEGYTNLTWTRTRRDIIDRKHIEWLALPNIAYKHVDCVTHCQPTTSRSRLPFWLFHDFLSIPETFIKKYFDQKLPRSPRVAPPWHYWSGTTFRSFDTFLFFLHGETRLPSACFSLINIPPFARKEWFERKQSWNK